MSDAREIVNRVRGMQESIGESLDKFGGFLRCERCGHTRDMDKGDAGDYTAHGWPRCCGYTMRWWTQSQIDGGEIVR